jgi:hypothetical protein
MTSARRRAARATCLALLALAPRPAGQVDPEDVIERHIAALGGEAALEASGDFLGEGRFESVRGVYRLRVLVRREPFAVREEYLHADWEPGRPAMALVTDLHGAWQASPSGPGATPVLALPFSSALPLMQRAAAWGLLLRPSDSLPGAQAFPPPFAMPDAPFFHDDFAEAREALTIAVHGPAGLTPNAWFDALDGRWLGWQIGPLSDGLHRLRVGRWRDAAGLRLPSAFLDFTDAGLIDAVFLERLEGGLRHDPGLFDVRPEAGRPPGPVDVGPLHAAPADVPGSLRLFAGDLRLNGLGPVWGLLDTGADKLVVDEELVGRLALPYISPTRFKVLVGEATAAQHWLDRLAFGRLEQAQLLAVSHVLPFPQDMWDVGPIGLIVGSLALRSLNPVLDLRNGRLLARGAAPAPLATLPDAAGAALAACALHADLDDADSWLVEVELGGRRVRALFDTGSLTLLRLSPAGLLALGLPTVRPDWERRGAWPYHSFGAAGSEADDLLVQLDEVRLPATTPDGRPLSIVFLRPWVLVAPADARGSGPEHFGAIVGAAALQPFARAGLDATRSLLELQAGPGVAAAGAAGAARWVVPAPGMFLGFSLASGRDATDPTPGAPPRVLDVDAGLPAARAGLRPGDRLLAIDGVACAGRSLADLVQSLWLVEGRSVRLTLRRGDGSPFDVTLP